MIVNRGVEADRGEVDREDAAGRKEKGVRLSKKKVLIRKWKARKNQKRAVRRARDDAAMSVRVALAAGAGGTETYNYDMFIMFYNVYL